MSLKNKYMEHFLFQQRVCLCRTQCKKQALLYRMNGPRLDLKWVAVKPSFVEIDTSYIPEFLKSQPFFFFSSLCFQWIYSTGGTCSLVTPAECSFTFRQVRRIALTRWLALKKRIQIKPHEPRSTGLSTWQRTKWQALHEKVTSCQHCHLLSFIFLFILQRFIQSKAEDVQIIGSLK